jgi:hydrogenase maturation factor
MCGRLGVIAAVNDLAAGGAVPEAVNTVILLPPGSPEEELREIEDQIIEVCGEEGLTILGGHTEVTAAVVRPLVIVTGLGRRAVVSAPAQPEPERTEPIPFPEGSERHAESAGSLAGCDIVLTKAVALEGTAILAGERAAELEEKFPKEFVRTAAGFVSELSVTKDARIALQNGARLMHDASEGGILAALWEFAGQARCGLEVQLSEIPIRQETVELAEYFDIDPYTAESAGCLLIAADDGARMEAALEEAGIPAKVAGRLTDGRSRILKNGDEVRFLDRPQPDSLLKILG